MEDRVNDLLEAYNKNNARIDEEEKNKRLELRRLQKRMDEWEEVRNSTPSENATEQSIKEFEERYQENKNIYDVAKADLEDFQKNKENKMGENLNTLITGLQELHRTLNKEIMDTKRKILEAEDDYNKRRVSKDTTIEEVNELWDKKGLLEKLLKQKEKELEKCREEIDKQLEKRIEKRRIHETLKMFHETGNETKQEGAKPEETKPEGEQTEGEQAEGEQTEGEQAEGEQTEGEQTEGEQAEGEQTEGEQTEGEQTEGEQTEGEQTEGEQAEGEQAEGEQAEGEQAEGEQTEGEQTEEEKFNNLQELFQQFQEENSQGGTEQSTLPKGRIQSIDVKGNNYIFKVKYGDNIVTLDPIQKKSLRDRITAIRTLRKEYGITFLKSFRINTTIFNTIIDRDNNISREDLINYLEYPKMNDDESAERRGYSIIKEKSPNRFLNWIGNKLLPAGKEVTISKAEQETTNTAHMVERVNVDERRAQEEAQRRQNDRETSYGLDVEHPEDGEEK